MTEPQPEEPRSTEPVAAEQPQAKSEQATLADLAILIVEAGLLTAFFSAVVFVAGWSYADRFFAELGLNLSAIDGLEAASFSAFALWVFRDVWLAIMIFVLFAAFALVLVVAFRHSAADRRLEAALALAVLGAIGLVGAGYLGAMRAERQVPQLFAEHYQAFSRVVVVANTGTSLEAFLAEHGDLGASTCLRKVFMDQRNLYAYAGYESLRGWRPSIYILPLAEIGAIEVVRNPGLCTP